MMVWTWVLLSPRVLGTERYHGLGMDALESVGDAEHEPDYGLGMDALESVGDAEHECYYSSACWCVQCLYAFL